MYVRLDLNKTEKHKKKDDDKKQTKLLTDFFIIVLLLTDFIHAYSTYENESICDTQKL